MSSQYVPSRGDLIWLTCNPQAGNEQAGRRPAVVVSPKLYNERTGLALFCPVATKAKGYPFEVQLPKNCPIQGVVLADQLKSLDWIARRAELVCETSPESMQELIDKLKTLIVMSD